ncbi:MAG: nucleotide sugar dehydrogenase [Actinomycetota bacterium]
MTSASSWFDAAADAIRSGTASTAVMGCGYVGLTLAVEHARAGSAVIGIETNDLRAKDLRAGANPIPDVFVTDDELLGLRDEGRLTFSTALETPADVYVICVNTPLRDGSPDLRYIESAGETVAAVLATGALVVLESTTYPGTTEELLRPILEAGSGLRAGEDFALAHSPERINPGDSAWNHRNTAKVVGGLTPESTELAVAFYQRICDTVVPVSSPRTAEITKLLENSYRVVNIALANEMSIVCNDFGIDPWEVISAASTKPYGFTPFFPGPGVGGECVPVDPQYLAWRVRVQAGRHFRLLETASDINDRMPAHVAQRAGEIMNERGRALREARVLLLGASFKGGSADARESPALRVADRLARSGAELTYHDPLVAHATINGVVYDSQPLTDDLITSSDLVIVLTDHPGIDYARVVELAPCVYDTRGVTTGVAAAAGRLYRA